MKKIFVIAGMLSMAGSVMAQEAATDTIASETVVAEEIVSEEVKVPSPGKCNWFVSAGAGPQVYFGDHDRQRKFGERIAPALDIAVGKWITPGIGLRLMYSGLYAKGATQNGVYQSGGPISGKPWHGYWLNESKFDFMNLHVDVMFDLCNLIGGYNPERVYSCIPYGGVGFAHVWNKPHNQSITGVLGVLNAFHISKAFDINADLRATAFNDNFDGSEGESKFEGLLTLSLGVTYKFAPRGFFNKKEIVKVTQYKFDNDAVNELRAQVADLVARNERLEKELQGAGKTVTHTVVKSVGADYLIYFPINVSSLSDADRAQLDLCAKVIKESAADSKYMIIGYADKSTGSPEINEILSRERAESVRSCLVNEFGVPVSRLEVSWKGGVGNMFYDDPALSRVVIITPVKK